MSKKTPKAAVLKTTAKHVWLRLIPGCVLLCAALTLGTLTLAGSAGAEEKHHDQRKGHDDGLNQAGDGGRHEAAQGAVGHDDRRGDDHGGHVVKAEEAVEQLAAGGEARGRVGHEEDDDGQRAQDLDELGVVAKARGEEVRHGDRARLRRVAAQASGDEQPVEPGAERQADRGPACLRDAAEQGQTGHAHQQVGAHVGGLGAHRGHDGAELAAAEVEVLGGLVVGVLDADGQHADQIDDDGQENTDRVCSHGKVLSFRECLDDTPGLSAAQGQRQKKLLEIAQKMNILGIKIMLFMLR